MFLHSHLDKTWESCLKLTRCHKLKHIRLISSPPSCTHSCICSCTHTFTYTHTHMLAFFWLFVYPVSLLWVNLFKVLIFCSSAFQHPTPYDHMHTTPHSTFQFRVYFNTTKLFNFLFCCLFRCFLKLGVITVWQKSLTKQLLISARLEFFLSVSVILFSSFVWVNKLKTMPKKGHDNGSGCDCTVFWRDCDLVRWSFLRHRGIFSC